MLRRHVLLTTLILANFSIGFTQSLGDVARQERARRNSFAAPVVAANAAVRPDASKTTVNALVKEAVRVSGARRQLQEAVETFRPSLAGGKIVDEALGLDRLTQIMERSVSDGVSENNLTTIVGWYGSPAGRKIAAAQVNAYSEDTPTRLQRYAAQLQEKAPTAGRRELVESIGAAGLGVPRPPLDCENDSWLLFVYDSLSDAELSNYVSFLNSSSATAFSAAIWNGIDAAFADASLQIQGRFADKR